MKKLNMYYHEEGDMLEVCIGKPTSAYFEEIDNGFFERRERKTGKRKGFIVFAFKKRLTRYDEEKDVLHVRIGQPTDCYYADLGEDVFERRDEKTDEVKGFMILNFKKRAENQINSNKLPIGMQVNA